MELNKIPSFTVDHIKLEPGVYISRIDEVGGDYVTTFDIRLKKPNAEPVINIAELHTIEHLGATFLRNDEEWKDKVVYFGPMGCRTGCYLLLKGKPGSKDILDLVKRMWQFIRAFDGEIPGATAKDCGNYLDQNLPMAKYEAEKYLERMEKFTENNLVYPE